MQTISVPLQSRSYPIWIDNGILKTLPELLQPMNQGQVWVIFSQEGIFSQHGHTIEDALQSRGFKTTYIQMPEGEEAKSLTSMAKAFSHILAAGCDRSSTFLALGGGVVGDVIGFLAATFMRGVDYIQIPTTLLAMVDSSIGGKTGINLPEGKNLVGAFWQPKAVVIDPEILETLPERELTSAMGEVIKYGAILDRELFDMVSNNMDDLLTANNSSLLLEVIICCAKLKADVVAADEREGNKRRILNFGHTIGHALETHFGFDIIRHGEAIAYGMIAAGKLSIEHSKFMSENYKTLKNTIQKLPLPALPKYDTEEIMKIMQNDKKVQARSLHFILLEDIGNAVVQHNVNDQSIINALEDL